MNVDVAVNGRPWKIAMEPGEQSGQFTVIVKGRKRVVDASWIDADTLSLIAGSASHEVRIHRREGGALGIAIDGKIFEAVVSVGRDARLKPRPTDPGAILAGSIAVGRGFSHAVKTPMAGRVVRVLVAVGDRVTARQSLVVVEAMKMENELLSPKDGTVKEVTVVAGAAVEAGTVLVVIE